jgi:hypothetical protein
VKGKPFYIDETDLKGRASLAIIIKHISLIKNDLQQPSAFHLKGWLFRLVSYLKNKFPGSISPG